MTNKTIKKLLSLVLAAALLVQLPGLERLPGMFAAKGMAAAAATGTTAAAQAAAPAAAALAALASQATPLEAAPMAPAAGGLAAGGAEASGEAALAPLAPLAAMAPLAGDMASEPAEQDSVPADEAALSAELRSLADSLSVVGIYEHVRNAVASEFYYGPEKGAAGAYGSLGGNDYDTAALLVGMLRHKGVPARYARGIASLTVPQAMGLTGTASPDEAAKALAAGGNPTTVVTSQGRIAAIRIERIWVECYLPYGNYRGVDAGAGANAGAGDGAGANAGANAGDGAGAGTDAGTNADTGAGEKSWIPLDAGFKARDGAGSIVAESLGLLPPALPYAVANRLESFSSTAGRGRSLAPQIDHDIPFRMALGEKRECHVHAYADGGAPAQSLSVALNGAPTPLSALGAFAFEAKDYGTYVFVIEAAGADGYKATLTHTLLVVEEADMEPPMLDASLDVGDGRLASPVKVIVAASDDSGSVDVEVTVNGGRVAPTDAGSAPGGAFSGVYGFTPTELGAYEIVVAATDPSGNRSTKSLTYTLSPASGGGGGTHPAPSLDLRIDLSQCFGPGDPVFIHVDAADGGGAGEVEVVVMADGERLGAEADGGYVFRPGRYGVFEVSATATGMHGVSAGKSALITLAEGGAGADASPPTLSLEVDAGGQAAVGKPVSIRATASDDSGSVSVSVTVDGVALAGSGGSYSFTPDRDGDYRIAAVATDPSGNYARQELVFTVGPGGEGSASGYPSLDVHYLDRKVYVGETAAIAIDASDAGGGPVAVEATANGEPLPYGDGVARFTPQAPGSYEINVKATNLSGNSSYASFAAFAVVNTEQPNLYIVLNDGDDTVRIGDPVSVRVGGTGIAGGVPGGIGLAVDGAPLALDAFGEASFTAARAGLHTFSAAAMDAQGNTLRAEATLKAYDPGNDALPTATLASPAEGAEITAPANVVGTASGGGYAYYTLSYAPAGSSDFTEFAASGQAVSNGVLGVFDPTMLENGYYTIRLSAHGARIAYDEATVCVQGGMKVGSYSISFTDMAFQVGGFPLEITRTYDSRGRGAQGDFGYGWTLGLAAAKLSVSCELGRHWSEVAESIGFLGSKYSLAEDVVHEVTVDWGGGKLEKFSMKLSPASRDIMPVRSDITAYFVPKGGSRSRLEAIGPSSSLMYFGGELVDTAFNLYNPQRYVLTAENGTSYTFDASGNVDTVRDALGNTVTITRNGVRHSDGKSIAFVRDGRNRITKIIGPTAKEVSYRYDEYGDLAEAIDAAGASVRYAYARGHFLTDIIDPRGVRATRNEYDGSGRLCAVVDADGNRVEFENDVGGRRSVVTDRLGNPTLYLFDERGNVLSRTDAMGNTTRNGYDANGNLASETDALGNTTRYEYSPDGNLLSLTNALGARLENTYTQRNELASVRAFGAVQGSISYNAYGQTTQTTDALGNATRYGYGDDGPLRSISDDIGLVMQFAYDRDGNVVSATDGANGTATFTYDADGNALSKTVTRRSAGPGGASETLTESYQHDLAGNVTKAVYPDGSFASFEYDASGNMTAASDSAGRRTTLEYDALGNLTRASYFDGTFEAFEYDLEGRNTKATDRHGQTIAMAYDKVGNLKSKTYADGSAEHYEHDAKYRLVAATDAAGAKTAFEYDAADRNTAIVDALGNRTEFAYNNLSQLSEVKDPRGFVTRYEYDLNGNRTKATLPDGNSITATYDARGRLVGQTDQNGYATRYAYDGLDRLVGVADPLGNEWKYTYNSVNELVAVADPNGNTTSYEYDALGRLARTVDAAGHVSSNAYDERGNLASSTDPNGVATAYQYDGRDRLSRISAGSNAVAVTYGANSQIEAVADANGTTRYTYDGLDRLASERKPDGATLSYEYDAAGRRTRLTTPYGSTSCSYDALGRLKTSTDRGGEATSYEYDPNGNLAAVRYPNGITTSYTYNPANALTAVRITGSDGAAVREYEYTLGKAGERLQARESGGRTVSYEYDRLYRLTKETVAEGQSSKTTAYAYDAAGNRTSKTEDGASTSYAYNALNQLTAEAGPAGAAGAASQIAYEYDRNGNRTKKTEGPRTTAYAYDEFGRLVRATVQEGQDVGVEEYRYDWRGNRIEKRREGLGATRYLVDANNWIAHVVAETDGGGALQAFYTRGGDTLVHMERGGARSYYLYDGLGSVRMLADESGAATDTYSFDAFGGLASRTGVTQNDYLFAGERYDWLAQLYYLRARYMDPAAGLFISMDAAQGNMFDPASLHKYMYANANPVSGTDPTGMFSLGGVSMSMSIQSALNGMATLNFVAILQWVRTALGAVSLVFAVRDFFVAVQAGDVMGMLLAVANGVVAVASIFGVCKLDTLVQILSKGLAFVSLGKNIDAFGKAVDEGDVIGALSAGIFIILDIVTLFSSCFTGDTPVAAEGGSVRIDEVEAGDYVWACDVGTGEAELKEVLSVSVGRSDEILRLVTTAGAVETTSSHPFFVAGKGWVAAGDLAAGDGLISIGGSLGGGGLLASGGCLGGGELLASGGGSAFVVGLEFEKLGGPVAVYNLEVDGLHTYFVGEGLLVHNTYDPNGTSKHHADPMYLGGDPRQGLTELPNSVHGEIHSMLDKFFPRQWGADFYSDYIKLDPNFRNEVQGVLFDIYLDYAKDHPNLIIDLFKNWR